MVWAQHPPNLDGDTALYIAEMDTPWSIVQPQVELTRPDYDWEKQLYKVNEGAAVIKRNGKIFMTYSASGTNHNYAVGLLSADTDADLMDSSSWKKSAEPVFKNSDKNSIYGAGHNSFTTTQDGEKDLMIIMLAAIKRLREIHSAIPIVIRAYRLLNGMRMEPQILGFQHRITRP